METALLAAISMRAKPLRKNEERASLTKQAAESEPPADGRPEAGSAQIIDFKQDEDGHWVAVLSCGHTQHLRHQPPWQSRAWVQDPKLRSAQLGSAFICGWCAQERNADKE
ncbi:DUF3565 domain-containing protein [Pseudomonas cavernae]|uniref:DUF3565 domain-containing protein n=1 Tax=Pseudomonas cavernae TaxID=2320867 RepID=A0A385Z6U5_9PSED|nr:DUF3565 domain-containing protein [Pseudomonas cavernae]AYC35019.1 DUF3565 domain-containing protein [Pseudomonas cavernae]